MFLQVVFLGVLSGAVGQATIDISALGETKTASAAALGQGFGAKVDGEVTAFVTDSSSASSSVVVASGKGGKGKDDKDDKDIEIQKPRPQPQPKYYPKPSYPPVVIPVPSKHYKEPVCEDIKDDKCYEIDEYYYCGFCILEAYPLKGYACKYTEEKVPKKKDSSSKKVYDYDYDTVIVPQCDCAGDFILKGDSCPGCDDILKLLLQCAGIKDPKTEQLEIPEKCLKEVGVTPDVLTKCGYLHPPSASKKEKEVDPKKIVVVKDDKKDNKRSYPVVPKDDKKDKKYPVVVPSSYASASASAVASGKGSAVATASAFAGGH